MIRSLAMVALLATAVSCNGTTPRTPVPFAYQRPCNGVAPGPCPGVGTPIPPYHRDAFGNGWAIVRGHCDTREIVLERDAGPDAKDTDGDGCRDDAPVKDLYTGRLVEPSHADADHVASLYDAWISGAWQWTPAQRRTFSQDQANLRAVGASINRSKGVSGPDTWRPPDRAGWCLYSRIYKATMVRWKLLITPAKNAALNDMMRTCPESRSR